MKVQQVNSNSQYNPEFNGRVIVVDKSLNKKQMKKFAKLLNERRFFREAKPNIYVASGNKILWFEKVYVYAQEGKLKNLYELVTKGEKAQLNLDSIASAAHRAIAKYNKGHNADNKKSWLTGIKEFLIAKIK